MNSNVSREVCASIEELATVRTRHFGGSYAIMHFSHVFFHVSRLEFSVASARTSDRRGVNGPLVLGQRLLALPLLPTPLLITHKTINNHFL